MPAHYSPEALKFLRSLARHNDRAWFDPRKAVYERELKAPTLTMILRLASALDCKVRDLMRVFDTAPPESFLG